MGAAFIPFALICCGVLIGILSGLIGVGGGLLIVPLLTLFFGLAQDRAGATSLAVLAFPVGILAVVNYHQHDRIDWTAAIWLALGMLCGAPLGARLVTSDVVHHALLRVVFALVLLYASLLLLTRSMPWWRATIIHGAVLVILAICALLHKMGLKHLRRSQAFVRLEDDSHDYVI